MTQLQIIDAHHHLWNLTSANLYYPWLQAADHEPFFLGDHAEICRNYLPSDYRRDASNHNIVHTVHIEAECDRSKQVAETEWLSQLNAAHGLPDAIVAHAWFHTDNAEQILARQASFPLVRGIRSKPVTRPAPNASLPPLPGTMQDPVWLAGLKLLRKYDLSWDLRVPTWHLQEAAEVVAAIPDIAVALNHMGFPWDRSESGLQMWRSGVSALAKLPNCYCKLSCLCLPDGPWDFDTNRDLVLEAIDLFGVDRCMFASNFPVDRLRVNMDTLWRDYKRMTEDFSLTDKRRLFYGTAAHVYRL